MTQARWVFREAVRAGAPSRPRLVLPVGVLLVQGANQYARRRAVQGLADVVQLQLVATQRAADTVSNTAYVKQLSVDLFSPI